MSRIKVRLDGGYGRDIYLHIANGEKRVELLNQCKAGQITNAEMNRLARKYPYFIKAVKVEGSPEKYDIIKEAPDD